MKDTLHIFAVNEPVTASYTNLTRQRGEVVGLPPLEEWLGIDRLDATKIELFPVDDLGGMALADYVRMAFDPAGDIPTDVSARLNALTEGVLLVPDSALSGPAYPGKQLTDIASIRLATADHTATLPKADATPTPHTATLPPERESTPPIALFALIAMAVFAVLVILVGWN